MPSLRDLQRDFAQAILHAGTSPIKTSVVSDNFSGASRLQIYRHNVFASLTAALKDVYPVVTRLVGEGFMHYAADAYIRAHPSRSGNLHDFGDAFAAFLAAFPPATELPYLPEVAHHEWAWHCVFHAAAHPPLSLQKLASIPPEHYAELGFELHPATRLISSAFPILRIWEVNQADYRGDQTVRLDSGADHLLIARPGLQVEIERLGSGEFAMLKAISEGVRFGAACERALAVDASLDIGASLQRRVQQGIVADLIL